MKPYRARTRKRRQHFLNYVPTQSMYCVGAGPDDEVVRDPANSVHGDWTPLVCHRVFQDALEDQDIPVGQGATIRGSLRNIRCEGVRITGTDKVPYERSDGRPIYEVSACTNFTRSSTRVWHRTKGWVEGTEEDLGGLDMTSGQKNFMLVAALGLLFLAR